MIQCGDCLKTANGDCGKHPKISVYIPPCEQCAAKDKLIQELRSTIRMQSEREVMLTRELGSSLACPLCGETAVMVCRCFRREAVCPKGHEWHNCLVHGTLVPEKFWKPHDDTSCSCRKGVPA